LLGRGGAESVLGRYRQSVTCRTVERDRNEREQQARDAAPLPAVARVAPERVPQPWKVPDDTD
jgi:hypothetical protein